jgi:hypothetical protein
MYEIAYHLKIPIYKLMDEMPYEELLGWMDYFEKRPVEWRADDRTLKLLQIQGFKGKPESIFTSLALLNKKQVTKVKDGMLDTAKFQQSFLFQKIMSAEGGDIIDKDSWISSGNVKIEKRRKVGD